MLLFSQVPCLLILFLSYFPTENKMLQGELLPELSLTVYFATKFLNSTQMKMVCTLQRNSKEPFFRDYYFSWSIVGQCVVPGYIHTHPKEGHWKFLGGGGGGKG